MKLKIRKNKVKKKKLGINFPAKYLYAIAWLVMIGTIAYLLFFLYENFYKTVAQTDEIILLKQEVASDTLNIQKIDQVLKNLNEKNSTSASDFSSIKNPFSSSETSSGATTPTEETEESQIAPEQ